VAESRRHILLTGDTVGGVWTFVLELAEGLIAAGFEVCLATFGGKASSAQMKDAARIPHLIWIHEPFRLEWMEDPWNEVKACGEWLIDIADRIKPDLIHLNTLCHGALPWNAPVTITVHSCVASWWNAVRRDPLPDIWNRYRVEVARSLASADMIAAPTNAVLASVRQHYGVHVGHARSIPNSRDATRFCAGAKGEFLFTAGRLWDEAKNIYPLAMLAPKLSWPVCLAGECRSPDGREIYLPNCRLLGQLSSDALPAWYARAPVYVLPAKYEPFGLSALEAAFSGCALILGDIPSLREVWGEAAVFVPPDDVEALEHAIRRMIAEPHTRLAMAARAFTRAQEYRQPRMATEYAAVYEMARSRWMKREAA